jgi:L-cystine uptake protein TcyP (sodium:dicarboxylate symporter family)
VIESVGIVFVGLVLLIVLALFVFWIWMLIECATRESDTGNTKLVWILVILFAHFIGAAVYFFARRPQRIAELRR